ncbi:MAG TPA: hypothetical protein VNG31_00225 [Candidatus Baltobacteraceae bacterium]|nr:hypothetical protein [Candidatus Baltobacteraceae bacterium]
MTAGVGSPDYESRLSAVLAAGDWQALREFVRSENQIPDDVYEKDSHFWEVLMHKLICNRIDLLGQHERSRQWLDEHGYSTDLGGY